MQKKIKFLLTVQKCLSAKVTPRANLTLRKKNLCAKVSVQVY